LAKASTEFDQSDRLIRCGGSGWKSIELTDLNRSERDVRACMGTGESPRLRKTGCAHGAFTRDAKVGLGLGTVVETEDGDYIIDKFVWQRDASFANPIRGAIDRLLHQRDAKGSLHVRDRAGEFDGAAAGRWRPRLHCERELLGESPDGLDGSGIGRVAGAELRSREPLLAGGVVRLERLFPPHNDRDR
jgi:hypothetical protein